jgi:hypothetical protein
MGPVQNVNGFPFAFGGMPDAVPKVVMFTPIARASVMSRSLWKRLFVGGMFDALLPRFSGNWTS